MRKHRVVCGLLKMQRRQRDPACTPTCFPQERKCILETNHEMDNVWH